MIYKSRLDSTDPRATGKFEDKDDAIADLQALQKRLYDLFYLMFAQGRHSLLIILQGIDASGKDGAVRHLFTCANPQGLRVYSFKKPSPEELTHDFLWRCHFKTPEAGLATIFNRSYYEEVTTTKVHPELLLLQHLPEEKLKSKSFFEDRYRAINDFEKMLTERGTLVLKFFLHISKEEQKKRLDERLRDKTKNWKFSSADIYERKFWKKYMAAYNQMIQKTSTRHAPWFILPADHKWYRDYLLTKILVEQLEQLKMSFPKAVRKK